MNNSKQGFTLVELMIVVAIIGFLAMISVPSFSRFMAKAKRAEAYMNLNSIYTAQKAHWAENGTYSAVLNGVDGIGWQPEGYNGGGSGENYYYTYGFAGGAEGAGCFTGKLNTSSSELEGTFADQQGFVIAAVGDIDGDGEPDLLTVDQFGTIRQVKDDLV